MLLTNRRVALIYLCLAGMEAAWLLPLLLLAYRAAPAPLASFAILFGALLAWMLALELLSRAGVKSPLYDVVALGAMIATGLLLVRVVLYPDWLGASLGWIGRTISETANYRAGLVPPALALIGFNLLLWQRATVATSRDLSFFSVGVAFRSGMLLLFIGGAVCTAVRGVNLLPLLLTYFVLGLTAVALARISEKASEAQSAGATMTARRLLPVLLAIGGTVGLIGVVAQAYTPAGVRAFLRLFDPLWALLRPLFLALLFWLTQLLNPALLWFEQFVIRMLGGQDSLPEIDLVPALGEQANPLEQTSAWLGPLLIDALIAIGIVLAVLALIVLLLLYLERVGRVGARA